MRFTATDLPGLIVIDVEPHADDRGFFARTYCEREFAEHGLDAEIVQSSVSFNHLAGTLRGMHFQFPPVAETKIVRCLAGAMLDVVVDLRPESPTFGHHIAVELSAANQRALYIPERFAHGFITLADATTVGYQISAFHTPGSEGGLAFDDPELGIAWPMPPAVISPRDLVWTGFAAQRDELIERMSTR